MRTFAEKPKAAHEVNLSLRRQPAIGNQTVQYLSEVDSSHGLASSSIAAKQFGHDFSQMPIRSPQSASRQPTSMANSPAHRLQPETDRLNQQALRTPSCALHTSAGGAECPRCRSERGPQERPYKDDSVTGAPVQTYAEPARGPRSDGLEDSPYRGPGTGTGMGCVFGPMRVVSSGALEGGYSVNDYLSGGLSWGAVATPGSAGSDGRGYKVQLAASFSNDTSLGVSQTMTHGGSNQAFLDGTAAYLGRASGSVTNGATFHEPVLNAGNPYAHTGWELQYGPKAGAGSASLVSFADVPRAGPGEKGYIDFRTCFYSRGGPCQENDTCRTWRWTIDFTGTNNTNTVS
jgi:hypothetical protein